MSSETTKTSLLWRLPIGQHKHIVWYWPVI